MIPDYSSHFASLIGKRCCRQRVGRWRSLSVGFGEKVPHSKKTKADTFYGEWELGSYSSAWRIVREGRVICGSSDVVNSTEELDDMLQAIALGCVVDVLSPSPLDIRVQLESEVFIDFLCTSSDNDEMFHIFGPESLYLEYRWPNGWALGKSDTPWNLGPG